MLIIYLDLLYETHYISVFQSIKFFPAVKLLIVAVACLDKDVNLKNVSIDFYLTLLLSLLILHVAIKPSPILSHLFRAEFGLEILLETGRLSSQLFMIGLHSAAAEPNSAPKSV